MIRAAIFDLDGLLIDSEPLWREGEARVYRSLGLPVTEDEMRETTGTRLDAMVDYWYRKYPWQGPSVQDVMAMVEQEIIRLISAHGEPLPGALDAVRTAAGLGLKTAIASSSSLPVIDAALERLAVRPYVRLVRSALDEPHGKPHPAVYLTTAEMLGVPPVECVAFEDSVTGVIAAKAARMTCVAVPEPVARGRREYGVADVVLDSMTQVTPAFFQQLGIGEPLARR